MNDTQLNERQLTILRFFATKPSATRKELEAIFPQGSISRITFIRDINHLISYGWLQQTGGGKYVTYSLISHKELFIPIDSDAYFQLTTDSRYVRYPTFHLSVIDYLRDIFTPDELKIFEQGKQKLTHTFQKVDQSIVKRELERFIIEFSWKSSQIEGNTYSLLETEDLIKNRREAKGHDKYEAIMILNHKSTFDTILAHKNTFQDMNGMDVRTIHSELTRDLDIKVNIREHGVGITGTNYIPLDNKWQIEEALEKIITQIQKLPHVAEKALVFLAMISYLQPFVDGNKRTARMVSNAILLANGYYPLSYRNVNEVEFKKALILFYEQNNLFHLKRIFLEQQQFAIQHYFI